MGIPQNWTLFFNWGCGGTYTSTPIEFNPDQTFKIPAFGESGVWVENGGTILFTFLPAGSTPTTYGGNVNGGAMVGAQIFASTPPVQGCFYAIEGTAHASQTSDKLKAGGLTPSGAKRK
ncbi:MAG TPA: hypothetical protein VFV34_24765 [Blastocatellia bacterium]|nr:hypothetical protein [Blastocatellia bacterium]